MDFRKGKKYLHNVERTWLKQVNMPLGGMAQKKVGNGIASTLKNNLQTQSQRNSSVNGVDVRIVIEYYVKSKKVYFGIAKLNDKEKVSQELLNSEKFQKIIAENGLTVKNNEWWYCLKFSTLDKVFQEYRHLIRLIN